MRRQNIKVLVVDHDLVFLRLLTYYLRLERYEVCAACNGQQVTEQVEVYAPDLVLLDVDAGQPAALTICQHIRERSRAPIICISAARTEEKSGLADLRADDYLWKPFDADELLAHVQRVLQRGPSVETEQAYAPAQSEGTRVKAIGDLTVDFAHSRVLHAGHDIPLSPREYRLLACLAQYAGRVVSQELLLQYIWGDAHAGEYHLLQVTINRLRRKLEPDPARPRFLLTKSRKGRAAGYLLTHPNEADSSALFVPSS